MQFDELKWKVCLEQIDDTSRTAIACCANNLEGLELRYVDIAQQMLNISLIGINRTITTPRLG